MFRRVKRQLVSLCIPKQTNDFLQVLMDHLHRGLFFIGLHVTHSPFFGLKTFTYSCLTCSCDICRSSEGVIPRFFASATTFSAAFLAMA